MIVTILAVMIRSMNSQFKQTNTRIDDTNRRIGDVRTDLMERLDGTNRRLERVKARVDDIGRDIGELRDRTGKLEGTLTTFIQSQGKVEAACYCTLSVCF